MTIQELYGYAKEKNILNFDIEVQHSDDGGFYYGSRSTNIDEIQIEEKIKSVII